MSYKKYKKENDNREALKLLSKWNVTEFKIPTQLQAEMVLITLFLDENKSWPGCYTKTISKCRTKYNTMCREARKAVWDKNGMLIFFADTYENKLSDEDLDFPMRNYCQVLETISWNEDRINFTPFLCNDDKIIEGDYSEEFDIGLHDFHRGSLCGFRVNARTILQTDLHASLCRRYLLNKLPVNEISRIILSYLGSCSFKHFCERILHNYGEPISRAFVREIFSDLYFPWGMHFKDILDYIQSKRCIEYYTDILYDLWFNRDISPFDRYYEECQDEKIHRQSRYYMLTKRDDDEVIKSVERKENDNSESDDDDDENDDKENDDKENDNDKNN